MKLVPVRTADQESLPWPRNSIYKYSSEGRFPSVIIRIGGKLFVDLEAFEDLARKARDKQVAQAKAARKEIGTL